MYFKCNCLYFVVPVLLDAQQVLGPDGEAGGTLVAQSCFRIKKRTNMEFNRIGEKTNLCQSCVCSTFGHKLIFCIVLNHLMLGTSAALLFVRCPVRAVNTAPC